MASLSQRSSSFSFPWLHFLCSGPAFGMAGAVSGGVFLSRPALLLSWKIPLNLPCPLFHTHLIGLDHFHLLLSQATAVQSVPYSSTFFIWIYWFYPACLGHSIFISALVNPATPCPLLSHCVHSDLCPHAAVHFVFCFFFAFLDSIFHKLSIKLFIKPPGTATDTTTPLSRLSHASLSRTKSLS